MIIANQISGILPGCTTTPCLKKMHHKYGAPRFVLADLDLASTAEVLKSESMRGVIGHRA
jgi:hypothetical protein